MAKRKPKPHRRELAVFRVGKGTILSLSWSPDGTRLVLGDSGHGVEVITRDGTTVWRSEGHTGEVRAVAWSPDGAQIASVAFDCSVRVWDALTGRERHRHHETGSSDKLYGLAWSPNGRELAWTRTRQPTVRVYGVDTWQPVREREFPGTHGDFLHLTWSPDGRWLGVSSAGAPFTALAADTLSTIWQRPPGGFLLGIRASPDSQRLAGVTADDPGLLLVWDAATGAEIGRTETSEDGGYTVSWSPDGRVLATRGVNGAVSLWSAEGQRKLDQLTEHTNTVYALAFAPSGGVLASGSEDGTVRLWDVSDLVPERTTGDRTGRVAAYLSLQARTVGRRPRSTGAAERWAPSAPVGTGGVTYCLAYFSDAGRNLDLFPDDRHFVTHTGGSRLVKWSLESGTVIWDIKTRTSENSWAVRISPDGNRIVVAANERDVFVHNSATGAEIRLSGPVHNNRASSAAWSPDGNLLATENGGEVLVWDSTTGAVVYRLPRHVHAVRDLDWSADGRLATGDAAGVIRVWAPDQTRPSPAWQSPTSNQDRATTYGVGWSPDGTRLAGTLGNVIRVWDPEAGRLVAECRGHTDCVYRVAWSPDGRLLASTSNDATVRVWDPITGAERARFQHPSVRNYTFGVSWAFSGAFLAAGSSVGACVWDTRHLLAPTTASTLSLAGPATPLPSALLSLPSALGVLHRLSLHPPLSALRDALALAAGQSPPPDSVLAALGEHPTVAKLRALNWPEPARRGLAAYLLRAIPHTQAFAPPTELPPTDLPRALEQALADATDVAPEPPPLPSTAVREALDALSDRALSVLRAIGHRAVATDPGLVARIVASAGRAPSVAPKVGRGSGSRSGGSAIGPFGGAERAGVSSRGDWRSVAPSQWALPVDVFAAKARRGEILFRSAKSARPDDRSPVVVVLDVSPSTWGPVGAAARAAAVSVLEARWRAGAGGWVVAAGGDEERIWEVRSPGDWAAVWSVRANLPGDGARALRAAEQVRRTAGWARGSVLVLSHVWFGAGVPRVGRVAAVLVRPPGGRGSGPRAWADRWTEVAPEPETTAKAAETLLAELSVS